MRRVRFGLLAVVVLLIGALPVFSQTQKKAPEEIVANAIAVLGGDKYLTASTLSSKGRLSVTQGPRITSFQSFVDIIVYPDKERTDFSEQGTRTVQVNVGDSGWLYDELYSKFGTQTETQIANFKTTLRTHYDYLLKGRWKGNAELTYVGRRQASVGVRNNVVKLEFTDGFIVEFEFSDKGFPMKSLYLTKGKDGTTREEENRYAQFLETDGIMFPYVLDHYTEKQRTFRVNYEKVYFNRAVKPSIFVKPATAKKLKKLKLK